MNHYRLYRKEEIEAFLASLVTNRPKMPGEHGR
jgi:hypothetical protein